MVYVAALGALAFVACMAPTDPGTTKLSPADRRALSSTSPLERSTFEAEVTISATDLRANGGQTKHLDVPKTTLSGIVMRGTGYVDLTPIVQNMPGVPSHFPVLETDVGMRHGGTATSRRAIVSPGHSMTLARGLASDGGPSTSTTVTKDGQTLASSTQGWQRHGDAWELRQMILTEFIDGQPALRTVLTVKVKGRKDLADASWSSFSIPSFRLAVTDGLRSVRDAALKATSPNPLYAQGGAGDPIDGGGSIFGKFMTALGAGIGIIGSITEVAAILVVGAGIAFFGAAMDLLAAIEGPAQIANIPQECIDYGVNMFLDPGTYYDPYEEGFCDGY